MPFFRNPKGVYVRTSPEMFQGNCAWGNIAGNGSGTLFFDVGIQNVDNSGRTMLVWGVLANLFFPNTTAHPTGGIDMGFFHGTEGLTPFSTVTPISPLNQEFNANLWTTNAGSGVPNDYTLMELLSGPGQVSLFPPYPIAAVPATWSIMATISFIVGSASADYSIAWLVEFVGPQP